MRLSIVVAFIAFGALAGCGVGPPAPYELHTHQGTPTLSQPIGPHPDQVTVAGGETLYGLSRRYGVPMRAIIDANHLNPPYRLAAGSTLRLPQVQTHLVQPGETLNSVARNTGVEASTLAATNHLGPPYVIRTGETLILPPAAAPQAQVAAAELPPPPVSYTPLPPPVPVPAPTTATAALGGPSTVENAPRINSPEVPPLPGAAEAPPASPMQAAPPIGMDAPPMPPPMPPSEPPPAQTASLPPPTAAAPLAVSSKGFLWPVRGRVLAAYGTTPDGAHNDGINIAAPEGTPVLAAAAGEVAYVGNELKGYGNLVLVKHPDGFVTAYAHNATLLVKRGEQVRRGQKIATVGATGAVSEPQLHFEIRRGSRALDPMDYLPAQAATASR